MSTGKPPEHEIGAPGLAGGPGPSPPGVDDGTPHPSLGATPQPAEDQGQSAEDQGEEARIAERTAGTRGDQIPERGGGPAEPAPGEPASPRRAPGAGERGGREGRRPSRGARRGDGERKK